MNFLFLTNTRFTEAPYRDASVRYRCYNPAEALLKLGHRVDVALAYDVDLKTLCRYDILVYSRPKKSRQLDKLLTACKQNRCLTIADFDDLVFVAEYSEFSPAVVNGQSSDIQMHRSFSEHAHALEQFDAVSVATNELNHQVLALWPTKSILTLPNGLSDYWLARNNHITKPANPKFITYLPGSRSHDQDFRIIETGLHQIMQAHTDLQLKIVGTLNFDEQLFPADRVIRTDWMDFERLADVIAESFVTIAPLTGTIFNRSKSHIKFIESAAFGTPVITSDNPDINQHSVDGLFVASTTADWSAAVDALKDSDFYNHCSEALTDYSRHHCMSIRGAISLVKFAASLQENLSNELIDSVA